MELNERLPEGYECLAGGGEMGALMRSLDWSKTPFGPVKQWPQSLRSALSICLNSRFPIAIYWGADCLLLYNDAWRPIVGNKHPWSLGRPGREVWPEIWSDIGPEFKAVLTTGEGTFHHDGLLSMYRFGYTEECFFDYTFNPIQGEGGVVDGILNIVSETTYRVLNDRRARLLREVAAKTGTAKTVEEACALTAEVLRSDSADVPFSLLYLIDPDGRQAHLCQSSKPISSSLIAPEQVSLEAADDSASWPIAQVVQTAQPQTVTDLVERFGPLPGSPWPEPPEEAMVLPIAGAGQGKVSGVLIAVASPRRRLDDTYRDFLEQVARQIATTITNARSYEEERRRAEELAELDRAKTTFFSNVSHEFRTPLTLMLGPVEDALQDTHDRQQRERLELVHRNTLRLQKLVNTLLDFSRIEAGRIEAVYEPTDLTLLTSELVSVFRSAIERAGLHLRVDCSPLPEPVYVDREMWEKIVLNLLSNAFKFTLAGEIAVTLRSNGSRVELEVQDSGIGIPADELPHIFDRFHRVKGAKGRSYEGSGIGLALVHELVRLQGGDIAVSSTVGQGTCFKVSVPKGSAHLPSDRISAARTLASTSTGAAPYVEEVLRWLPEDTPSSAEEDEGTRQGEAQEPARALVSAAAQRPHSPPARILLADDNADMRDYLKRLLSQQYEVEVVADGEAALAAIQQQIPDLLLSDVMMPGLDGFELLKSLRCRLATQDLPVILLSARAGEEARIEGLAAGADDYLTKPFSARELLARVEASLKLARLRQDASRAIELSEERSRLAIRLAQLGTWHYDPQANRVELDERMREIWGEPAEAVALPLPQIMDRIHPEDRARVADAVAAALDPASSGNYEIDYRIVWDDGSVRWVVAMGQATFAGEGPTRQAVGLLGTSLDMTDRKRGEERLHLLYETTRDLLRAEQPLQVMSNLFSKLSAQLDLHCYYNHMVEETEDGPILCLRNYEGIAPEVVQAIEKIEFGQYLCGLVAQERQQIVLDQAQIAVHPRAHLIQAIGITAYMSHPLIAQGRLLGTLSFASRTRTRFTPEEVELLRSACEQIAIALERVNLVTSIQQQAEQLQQANRVKDEFLAVLSHELRSPLNPILGWSKLLQTGNLSPDKTAQALGVIERNAKLQSELIDDLLDVSRILQGKLSLNVVPVDLASTVQSAMETVHLAAAAKSIQLCSNLDPQIGQVAGDAARLQQIVWNLLTNAVKFTPENGRVDIRLEQHGTDALITVSDTGKGISADFLPHVFAYFRQADATTTRKFGGLGLGLAIVHHLVELHGGSVWAASPGEGLGATFTVRLPLLPSQPKPRQSPPALEALVDLSGIKAVIVDDDADTREFIEFLLGQAGAVVVAASSAKAALEKVIQTHPDILISDIGMPDISGYTLIQQVRALPPEQGGQVLAIALTAYASELDEQQALRCGFQKHVSKPVEPSVLMRVIIDMLGQTKRGT